jgi:hypothetical protein
MDSCFLRSASLSLSLRLGRTASDLIRHVLELGLKQPNFPKINVTVTACPANRAHQAIIAVEEAGSLASSIRVE